MNTFEVKLLGHKIIVVKQEVHSGAEAENGGCAFCTGDLVFVNASDKKYAFEVIIHELTHHFFWIGGRREDDEECNLERICNITPAFIAALVTENGFDIFEKMYKWINEEEGL